MKRINSNSYLKGLSKRNTGHITRDFQLLGLEIADILGDRKHKALYIKYAKQYSPQKLMTLAKSVAQRHNVKNPAAYFMKLVHTNLRDAQPKEETKEDELYY